MDYRLPASECEAGLEGRCSDGLARRCRLFYERRVRVAASLQQGPSAGRGGLGQAMHHLRRQMATLITEDNSLFRQLLALNETIEDLKQQQQGILRDASRCSSFDSLSDPEVADQSASPTSTLSSTSSSSNALSDSRPRRYFRPVFPPPPPIRPGPSWTPSHQSDVSRPLHIVTKDANGRLVLLRPCKGADGFHVTDAGSPYDSGFQGSESDAENNEIFV